VFELATSSDRSMLMPRCRNHANALRVTLVMLIRREHWSESRVAEYARR
jgi:hypothetical protein